LPGSVTVAGHPAGRILGNLLRVVYASVAGNLDDLLRVLSGSGSAGFDEHTEMRIRSHALQGLDDAACCLRNCLVATEGYLIISAEKERSGTHLKWWAFGSIAKALRR